jgi:transposase
MIDYPIYCQIHRLHHQEGLRAAQIARHLNLDVKTVTRWLARKDYQPRKAHPKASKLDPFKSQIIHWLNSYDYSAAQVLIKLRELGYPGQYTIVKDFVRQVRPKEKKAYLTLNFEPAQCAQVDWASYGSIPVENTQRKLSFFAMVLCYSRMLYVEFTLSQSQEQFLACHLNAWDYFGACVKEVMVDNCKVAVLAHPPGGPVVLQPRYLEFAQYYGFSIKACSAGQPQQKGRVENAVAYVKKNFLAGREITTLSSLNAQGREWLDTVANQRLHGTTKEKPSYRFEAEKPQLQSLPLHPYDCGLLRELRVSKRCRVTFESNHYSVPPKLVGLRLPVKIYPDKIRIYHQNNLVAQHPRSYGRALDFEQPDHARPLLAQKYKNKDQRLMIGFLALTPKAQAYLDELKQRRLNTIVHVRKIMALCEGYGEDAVARALEDALEFGAFSSEYIINLLEQHARPSAEPGAIHLTRSEDLLELELPEPDLSIYDQEQPPQSS